MKYLYLLAFTFILIIQVSAQNYEKVSFGSSDDDYYLAVAPKSEEILGAIVLLPGFGQQAESVFPESKIHNVAYVNGLLTISIAAGQKLYADELVVDRLDKALNHIVAKYGLAKDRFIIGGFSAGGTVSLRYVEHCYENKDRSPIQPLGVFSVDSPVDLFEIWDYMKREIKKNYSEIGVGEAQFVSKIMLEEIGNPEQDPSKYEDLTPFYVKGKTPGNEQFLRDISVRVYHDIDVSWQLQNRRRSLFDSNALPASELINRLMLMGNEQAEFVQAKQAGYRSAGFRHTHSWSIVDEVEFIKWAKGILSQ